MTVHKHGFTLFEILIALVIILTIFSVVYGTYFATTRSAARCQDNLAVLTQARLLLSKLSRPLSCLKPGPDLAASIALDTKQHRKNHEFSGCPTLGSANGSNNVILRCISTAPLFSDNLFPRTPYELYYKYDAEQRILYYAQRFPLPSTYDNSANLSWIPIARQVAGIRFRFFDGEKWHGKWNSAALHRLPAAVAITLILENNNQEKVFTRVIPVFSEIGNKLSVLNDANIADYYRGRAVTSARAGVTDFP